MNTEDYETEGVTKLPLWQNAVDEMIETGIDYGKVYPAEFFEKHLKCDRNTMSFGLGVSHIRRSLEDLGYYLTGRGQKGDQFVIVENTSNQGVGNCYMRRARDCFDRAFTLLVNTKQEGMTVEEKRRHDATAEKVAIRRALLNIKLKEARRIVKPPQKALE